MPNPCKWLREAFASASRRAAGCPRLSKKIGSSALAPAMPSIAMSSMPGIETDRRIPLISNLIGLASAPPKLLIRGASAAIGPPPWPLAIVVSASRCSLEARSSRTRPTVQLPWIIGPGVCARTAKLKPSSRVLPYCPRSTRKTSPTSQKPLVGFAAIPDVGHGHTESQLQASKYSPLICHRMFAMINLRQGAGSPRRDVTSAARVPQHNREIRAHGDGDAQEYQYRSDRVRD